VDTAIRRSRSQHDEQINTPLAGKARTDVLRALRAPVKEMQASPAKILAATPQG
jgi:hypothetical protein